MAPAEEVAWKRIGVGRHADPDTEETPEQCHLIGPVECGPPSDWAVTGWPDLATHGPDRVHFALTRVHAQESPQG